MNHQFNTDRQRDWARELFTHQDMPLTDIALKVGATEADLRLWMQQGDWQGLKRSLLTSREFQLGQLYKLLENLTEKMKQQDDVNSKDADLLVKYTAAIKNLDAEVDVPSIVQVARLFTTWLRRKNVELAQTITVQFDAFIKHRLMPIVD
jgi:hypothetical protein